MSSPAVQQTFTHPAPTVPQTRASLLLRIKSPENHEAWRLFVNIYGPTIYHYCRRRGLQDADAADVMQEALLQVSKSIARFEYRPDRGRFRGWLKAVVHSKLCRYFAQRSESLETCPAIHEISADVDSGSWRDLVQQQLLAQALQRLQAQAEPAYWSAFEMLWRHGKSAAEVAEATGKTVPWVYVAKSRMLSRLQATIRRLADDLE